jgi:hypothetical protein
MKYSTLVTAAILPAMTIANPLEIKITTSDLKTQEKTCESDISYCGHNLLEHHGKSSQCNRSHREGAPLVKRVGPNVLTYLIQTGYREEDLKSTCGTNHCDEDGIREFLFKCEGDLKVAFRRWCPMGCEITPQHTSDECYSSFVEQKSGNSNDNHIQVQVDI